MKKRLLGLVALMGLLAGTGYAQNRECASHENYLQQMQNPKYQHQMQLIEENTQQFIEDLNIARQYGRLDADGETVIIPTVVHVIYKTSQQNISDAQVLSQISVLNEDFAALNSDYSNIPSEFTSVASGNTKIQFEMATEDPNGNPTNGITRKYSSRTSWGTNDAMKYSSQGGVDAWPTDEYLNIWVCNIGSGILGYAQFPGGNAATDGVVISPNYFGSVDYGSNFYLSAPFNKGRTGTHEVGHWLNLRHIWGDGVCATDYVDDTPSADGANYGCPSHPHTSCLSNDMFMNYMDYVDDACMYMFSAGQKDRMRAVFFGASAPRASFVATGGGGGGGGGTCNDTEVTLTLNTDNYGSETSWELRTAAGTLPNSGSGYGNNQTYTETFCLADGDYEFTIFDSYGDGICCGYGNGSYDLSDASTTYASGGSFGASEATSFTIGTGGGGGGGGGTPDPAPTNYCASQGNNTSDEYIQRVQIGSIDNNSGNNGGYGDFTALKTTILAGSSNNITITPTWTGTVYNEAYSVWIDYNRDGDFADAGELVYSRSKTKSTPISGSFTAPSSFSEGYTRMRVSMKYNANPTSCETFTYGEVEDYEVELSLSAKGAELNQFFANVDMYPNPASEQVELRIESNDNQELQVQVITLQGQTVLQEQVQASKGISHTALDLSNLPAGIYVVKLNGDDLNFMERLVIQ